MVHPRPVEDRSHGRSGCWLAVIALAVIGAAGPLGATEQTGTDRQTASDTIRIGANVLVSGDLPDAPLAEAHLAVSPIEPGRMLAAAIIGGYTDCALFASDDGGGNWSRVEIPRIEGCGDPWVAFGPAGSAYLALLPSAAVVLRSPDGGRTWNGPDTVPGELYDRTTVVVDNTDAPTRGTVYVVMMQATKDEYGAHPIPVVVSRSQDGGRTFSEPVPLLPTNLRYAIEAPVILRDGTVMVSFDAYADPYTRNLLRVRQEFVARYDPAAHTFDAPSFVAEVSHFWGSEALAVDTSVSSDFRDRVYAAYGNTGISQTLPGVGGQLTSMPLGVFLRSSDDHGHTWSSPTVVSGAVRDPRQMTVAVNAKGVVGVAWNQPSATDETCLEPWFSASLDGGETFLEPRKVASTASCPRVDVPGNVYDGFDVGKRFPSGGDYMGLAADHGGVFHLVWADSRNGLLQLWTAPIRVER